MAYDPTVLRQALAAAGNFGATPREKKALVEAGLVESDLQALKGGDRDSTGFLQQRPSQGWGPVGESVGADALQFLRAARQLTTKGFNGSAGALAQAVQRSAFPGRYDERAGDAVRLLGGAGSGSGSSYEAAKPEGATALPEASMGGVDVLAAALQRQRPQVQSSGVQAPSFAAAPALPQGFQSAMSGGGPQPRTNVLGDALRTVAASVSEASRGSSPGGSGASASEASPRARAAVAGGGAVRVAAGANKPGQDVTPGLLRIARIVSSTYGEPLDLTTGTNHSRLTVNGNVSDHSTGNAGDFAAKGRKLTNMATAALVALGDGQTVQWLRNDGSVQNVRVTRDNAQQLAAAGGIFNVPYGQKRRIQVIANTHQGGDHTNHLHLGVTGL